jgi:hypothetical protein
LNKRQSRRIALHFKPFLQYLFYPIMPYHLVTICNYTRD